MPRAGPTFSSQGVPVSLNGGPTGTVVPEPASIALVATGLLGLLAAAPGYRTRSPGTITGPIDRQMLRATIRSPFSLG